MSGATLADLNPPIQPTTPPTLDETLANAIELHRLSPANDAFGRSRVSHPSTLFASSFEYDGSPLVWESILTATGTATVLQNEAAVRMRVAASGDKVIRQTYRYFRSDQRVGRNRTGRTIQHGYPAYT